MFYSIKNFIDVYQQLRNIKRGKVKFANEDANKFEIRKRYIRLFMQVFISIIILFFSLYVLISKNFNSTEKKWAAGWVGAVFGYWIR